MDKESIELSGAPMYGPYTPGVKSNGTVWLSGQIKSMSKLEMTSFLKLKVL